MLILKGQLINTFVQPRGERDGKEFGGQDKIQILGDIELPDGGKRVDMFTLTTHDIESFENHVGKEISVPVGVFANGRSITFFIPRGSSPKPESQPNLS